MKELTQTTKMPRSLATATASATVGTTASPPATSIGLPIAGSTKSFCNPRNKFDQQNHQNPQITTKNNPKARNQRTHLHVDDEHGRLAPLGDRHGSLRFGGAARDPWGYAAAGAEEPTLLEVVEEEFIEGEEQHQQARQQRQM